MPEQLAGADLARSILNAHRAAARTAGTLPTAGGKPTRKAGRRRHHRGTGRDPVSLADVVQQLTGGNTSASSAAAGSGLDGGRIIDQWATLCPQYDGLVQPVHYDPDRARLDLRPCSHAYAAQLRLLGGQLCRQINDKLGRPAVKLIRVLPVGALTAVPRQAPVPAEEEESLPPVKTRETASPGYRAALETALAHRPERAPRPDVRAVEQQQDDALRAHREPESVHAERVALWSEDRPKLPEPGSVEASLAAAIAYKRREAAGLVEPRRVFDVA